MGCKPSDMRSSNVWGVGNERQRNVVSVDWVDWAVSVVRVVWGVFRAAIRALGGVLKLSGATKVRLS